MTIRIPPYDYSKLTKNIVAAVLTPAATVFSTTGDMEQTKHAALLGVGAAGLILLGFVQSPYKRTQAEKDAQDAATPAEAPPAASLPEGEKP